MTVKEAIFHLQTARDEPGLDLSPEELESLNLALVVLKTLTPSQEALIDAIMSLEP